LRDAPKVTIVCDNEKDTETQARTDAQHATQRDAVASFNSEVLLWHPPVSYGDIADLRVANEIRRREAEELRQAEARVSAIGASQSTQDQEVAYDTKNRKNVERKKGPEVSDIPKGPSY